MLPYPWALRVCVYPISEDVSESEFTQIIEAVPISQPEVKESTIGGSGRRSVANDEPQALREAANNPVVHEVLDLFSGTVVDVHR